MQFADHRLALAGAIAALSVTAACVFGFRGEVSFADEASLDGVETVRLELPATQLVVAGEASRTFIDWSGTWRALGGGSEDALDRARAAEIRWETWSGVGRLSALIPLSSRDLTSLAQLEVETAAYLPLEIVGAGDVFVSGVDAHVSVDLDGGSVEILGGTQALTIDTRAGDVDLTTSAAVDVFSGYGGVIVRAEAARDIEVETTGAVVIELSELADFAIDIEDAGEIRVELDGVAHLGSGSYRRTLGSGDRVLEVRAGGGRVRLRMAGTEDSGETSSSGGETSGETG